MGDFHQCVSPQQPMNKPQVIPTPFVPSVSSHSTTILTRDQAALVDDIKTYHAGCRKAFEHQVQYAFMAGLKLLSLKESCPHGNSKDSNGAGFNALCASELPDVSRSAAHRYMDFTNLLLEKCPTVGFIRESNLLLENGDLPSTEKESVLKAVYDAAEGKTWTAFYRDLDLCRKPEPHSYHPPTKSPEHDVASKQFAADESTKQLINAMQMFRVSDTWSYLSADRRRELEDARIDLGHFIKTHSSKTSK